MKIETITRTPKNQTHKTPLLFVHGMWHGAWCWDEFFLPYFADNGYHVTALSLRGHAGSEGKICGSTIANYVSDVEQVAKTFDTPPVVIGHSMGGFLTQKYLERNDAPAAVLLASNPHFGLWPTFFRLIRQRPLVVLKATDSTADASRGGNTRSRALGIVFKRYAQKTTVEILQKTERRIIPHVH